MERILAINPGATSTKIGVFDGDQLLIQKTMEHHGPELKQFTSIIDQAPYRLGLIEETLQNAGIPLETLSAVVGRGGLLRPLTGGTYTVNEAMLNDLRQAKLGEHASNLGAILADLLHQQLGIPAFIVDPVSVDEYEPEARLSGLPELPRICLSHALNSKAVARKIAAELGKPYTSVNLIVAHLGTGISVSAHRQGRMIDVNNGQEDGPFAPDRSGGLPTRSLINLCFSGEYTRAQLLSRIMGSGGMYAYLGTKDIREAEQRATQGDSHADLVLRAMTYQIAKEIGAMATVLAGQVERIVLTGGMAHSKRMVEDISVRVGFIAPIIVSPGEEELSSLAAGALRVLRHAEASQVY